MRNRLTDELAVCGMNAVKALAEFNPNKINRLFLRQDRLPIFTKVCKSLAERKRPYKLCENEELERICKTNHHQGVVAMIYDPVIEPATPEDLDEWDAKSKTGLLLCNIGNDHNLGAIVRSAAFFDASPIILCGEYEEGRHLTTSAYRVAEGGMEHVEFRTVQDSVAFIRSASKKLVTIAADPRARIRVSDIGQIIRNNHKSKVPGVLLVIGNEETGLSKAEKTACAMVARVPGTGLLDSLNASQATALFLHELFTRNL